MCVSMGREMLILAGNSEGLSEVGKVSGPGEAALVTGVGGYNSHEVQSHPEGLL